MHFSDFRTVDDMQVPFLMTITFKPTDDVTDYLHEIVLTSVALDAVDPDSFGLPSE